MEQWTKFKCILTKNIFFIVDLLDYWNYFDVFQYGLLYSQMILSIVIYFWLKWRDAIW